MKYDIITGYNDMVVVFKNHECAQSAGYIFKEKNINSCWFDSVRYVLSKDIEQIKKVLSENNIECEIKPIKWMSVEEAIDRTIIKIHGASDRPINKISWLRKFGSWLRGLFRKSN